MAKKAQEINDIVDLFPNSPIPTGLERINYIATSREEVNHLGYPATRDHDVPIMRVRGGVGSMETKTAKDGRQYDILKGTFVATPCPGGPQFPPMASGKFIPPDCVAGEIGFAGCPVDMVIVKRFTDKSPGKFTLIVVYSPTMDDAINMTGELAKTLAVLNPPKGGKSLPEHVD